jgi:hypothetical protein
MTCAPSAEAAPITATESGRNRRSGLNRPIGLACGLNMMQCTISQPGEPGQARSQGSLSGPLPLGGLLQAADSRQREIFSFAASSPMMPRRNASTQTTKMTPCATVTQAPNWAR